MGTLFMKWRAGYNELQYVVCGSFYALPAYYRALRYTAEAPNALMLL